MCSADTFLDRDAAAPEMCMRRVTFFKHKGFGRHGDLEGQSVLCHTRYLWTCSLFAWAPQASSHPLTSQSCCAVVCVVSGLKQYTALGLAVVQTGAVAKGGVRGFLKAS